MANKVSADKSAWIDQIERARHELMLAIRSAPLTKPLAAQALLVDEDVQRFVDRAIDAETGQ